VRHTGLEGAGPPLTSPSSPPATCECRVRVGDVFKAERATSIYPPQAVFVVLTQTFNLLTKKTAVNQIHVLFIKNKINLSLQELVIRGMFNNSSLSLVHSSTAGHTL